jgi:ribosome-associated protein
MLEILPGVTIPEEELHFEYSRAAGPGGQNVNKVSTAVQLRFDVRGSPSIPDEWRRRLAPLAGKRLTQDGILVIEARRYRTQEQNRQDALQRLAALLRQASIPPKPRQKTHPTQASQEKRLQAKRRRGLIKRQRRLPPEE